MKVPEKERRNEDTEPFSRIMMRHKGQLKTDGTMELEYMTVQANTREILIEKIVLLAEAGWRKMDKSTDRRVPANYLRTRKRYK